MLTLLINVVRIFSLILLLSLLFVLVFGFEKFQYIGEPSDTWDQLCSKLVL